MDKVDSCEDLDGQSPPPASHQGSYANIAPHYRNLAPHGAQSKSVVVNTAWPLVTR
jgi:hypothetical protein